MLTMASMLLGIEAATLCLIANGAISPYQSAPLGIYNL